MSKILIETINLNNKSEIEVYLAPGGGIAIELIKK